MTAVTPARSVLQRARGSANVWVWAVFLVIPIFLIVVVSDASVLWRVVGVVATIAFGLAFVRFMHVQDDDLLAMGRHVPPGAWRIALLAVARLCLLVALTVPSLGPPAVFMPYLAAVGLFTLPLTHGLLWAAVVAGMAVLGSLPFLQGPEWLQLIGPLVAAAMVVAVRVVAGNEQAAQLARTELATVEEREAISRDVHDILGHTLTIVSLKAQLARRVVQTDPQRAESELDDVVALTASALDDVRATVGRLRIPDLASQLATAREALEAAGIEVTVSVDASDLSADRRALAAWLVREATTNVLRHAQASRCTIEISAAHLSVTDDGLGIASEEGHGLSGLRRRVAGSGGTLHIVRERPDAVRPGTRVEVVFA